MNYLSASITARITEQVKIQLPQILPKEVSNFSPPVIQSMVTKSLEHAVLAKESSQPKSSYEAASSLTEFELKKILIDKMDEMYSLKRSRKDKDKDEDPSTGSDRGLKKRKTSKDTELTKGLKAKESQSGLSKGTKSQSKSSGKTTHVEEPEFEVESTRDWFTKPKQPEEPIDPDWNVECYKALSEKLDWDNPEGGDYPFDLTKPLPLVMNGNRQMVPVDYFFNNDLTYLQGGISTMTYTTSTTKTKDAQYDLQGIEDMKTFYAYARGLESSHDVYSSKRILVVTRVEVMRKHGYGYLRDIEVRRADDDLYTFKEGDFPRLRINDIEDMLILIRVEDLQLGVKSYQKKINVTRPETTRPNIKKRDPYTSYQDPQGFIYVDNQGRNRLMRSDELYKFSDGTLTRLRTSFDDITKNIHMEYLPQRRWSTLEKKRAHIIMG
ncbi:hypothetical protein Tco_0866190 [Tanacetum coccineum]